MSKFMRNNINPNEIGFAISWEPVRWHEKLISPGRPPALRATGPEGGEKI